MLFEAEIGTAKDNLLSPIHNWYKFTAGFSHKLVNELINSENITCSNSVFDPFAGCGTTLVSAQKLGVKAYGNEAQSLMHDIILGKLNWDFEEGCIVSVLENITSALKVFAKKEVLVEGMHPLLLGLYIEKDLNYLYFIRNYLIENEYGTRHFFFFKLALAQCLHKLSSIAIASPYIIRNKSKVRIEGTVAEVFTQTVLNMWKDIESMSSRVRTSEVFLHDSRKINYSIPNDLCDICITSPPYLNNLDYGEISKVHTHFFDITNDWSDVTSKVRKNLVTGSTTHYKKSDFDLSEWQDSMPLQTHPDLVRTLITIHNDIQSASLKKGGKKSFHILACMYFYDMLLVLKEMRRVLKPGSKAFLVLGDSAPYGSYVPTTSLIGQLAHSVGFDNSVIYKLRDRGSKWKNLKHRHSVDVSENVLKIW